jgi:hypothetical protein
VKVDGVQTSEQDMYLVYVNHLGSGIQPMQILRVKTPLHDVKRAFASRTTSFERRATVPRLPLRYVPLKEECSEKKKARSKRDKRKIIRKKLKV